MTEENGKKNKSMTVLMQDLIKPGLDILSPLEDRQWSKTGPAEEPVLSLAKPRQPQDSCSAASLPDVSLFSGPLQTTLFLALTAPLMSVGT